jgi:hypothetical protein
MGSKPTPGVNDLLTKCPELAKEACGWDPAMVCYGSQQVLLWKGQCGHEWESSVYKRSSGGHGCPYCAGKRILIGFNDLQTVNPELAAQAVGWDPTNFTGASKR